MSTQTEGRGNKAATADKAKPTDKAETVDTATGEVHTGTSDAPKPEAAASAVPPPSGKTTLAKRISTASLIGKVNVDRYESDGANKAPVDDLIGSVIPGRSRDLYSIVGVTNKMRTGETDKGPWTSFLGSFMAILPNGDRVRASQLFLPDVAGDLVIAQMTERDDDKASIQLGFTIGIKSDPTAATGYVYTAQPLIETAPNDPLALLANQALSGAMIPNGGNKAISDHSEIADKVDA